MTQGYRGFPTAWDYYIAHPKLHHLYRSQLAKTDSGLSQRLRKEDKWEHIPKGKMGPPKGQRKKIRWGLNKEYTTSLDYYMGHPELHHLSPTQLSITDNSLYKNLERNGLLEELFPDKRKPAVETGKISVHGLGIDSLLFHEARQEGRIFGYADLHTAAYYVMKQILEHGETTKIPEQEKNSSGDEVRQREFATPGLKRIVDGFREFGVNGDNQKTLFIGGLRLDYRHDQYFVDSLVMRSNRSENPPLDGVYRIDINGSNRVRLLRLFKDGYQIASTNFELSSPRRTIRAASDVKVEMKEIGNGQHLLSIAQGQVPEDFIDLVKRVDANLMGTYIAFGGVPFTQRQFLNWMFSGGE